MPAEFIPRSLMLTLLLLQKVIFHLEAFVAKFMRIYERYVLNPLSPLLRPTHFPLAISWAWSSRLVRSEYFADDR